jgi:DNA-binding CsgD family transcriptional regulator
MKPRLASRRERTLPLRFHAPSAVSSSDRRPHVRAARADAPPHTGAMIRSPLAPLVGRDAEMAALLAAAGGARQGEGGLVLVHGEAGIGKSRLCRELAASLQGAGTLLLEGQAYPGDDTVAHAVVVETLRAARRDAGSPVWPAVRRHADRMSAVLPELAEDGTRAVTADDRQVFEAVLDVVEDAAAGHPVVWIAEDVQWADPLSWSFLAYCSRRAGGMRLLVVASFRDDEAAPEHPAWTRMAIHGDRERISRIGLRRLSEEEAIELARQVTEVGTGEAALREIVERSGGTPLLVEELAAIGASVGPQGGVPAVVRATVRERARMAGERSRPLLERAAILGRDTDLEMVLEHRPKDAHAVDTLVYAGLLHPTARSLGMLEFRHPLLREAVYDDIPVERRRLLHAEAAEMLTASGSAHVAERAARHWELAGRPEAALDTLLDAMNAARGHRLFRRVTTLGLLALELIERRPRLSERRRTLVGTLVDDLRIDGRLPELLPIAREAWRDADRLDPGRPGNFSAAAALATAELARACELDVHTRGVALLALQAALCAMYDGDPRKARELTRQAIAEAATAGDLDIELAARGNNADLGVVRFHEPRAEAVAAHREFAARAAAAGLVPRQAAALIHVAHYTLDAEDCWATIALGGEGGAYPVIYARMLLGSFAAFEGRAAEALACFEEVEQSVDERFAAMHGVLTGRSLLALMLGDVAGARASLERLRSGWEPAACEPELRTVEGWLAWETGDAAAAVAAFAQALRAMEVAGLEPGICGPYFVALHVDALLRSGDRDGAESVLAVAGALLDGPECDRLTRASFATARLRLDPGPATLAAAEEAVEDARWPWLQGLAWHWAGEFLGDGCAADGARAVWQAIGYATGAERAAALAAKLPARRTAGQAAPELHGDARLTRRERHVASLIAAGLTNAQIAEELHISPVTVAHHVSSILGKLDLSSRTQVAVQVVARDVVAVPGVEPGTYRV